MRFVHVAEPHDADRVEVEAFIQNIYGREYGAHIAHFAPQILCRTGVDGDIHCAAGLRLPGDGFFSERYLDEPVEAALSRASGQQVRREEVFEVTTLASHSPREISAFIDDIITFGARHGLSWCFFTLTRRLSLLVHRRHLAPLLLAAADPARIPDAATWGRYYETEPKVFGVCGARVAPALCPAQTAISPVDAPLAPTALAPASQPVMPHAHVS